VKSAGVIAPRLVSSVEPLERVLEVPGSEIERHGDAGLEVDQVHRVVGEVVVVAAVPSADVRQIERCVRRGPIPLEIEGDAERHERAPALELIEPLARVPLDVGRRDQAGVDPEARAARRIAPRRGVVRQRNVGQRRVREVEAHLRSGPGRRAAEVERSALVAGSGEGGGRGQSQRQKEGGASEHGGGEKGWGSDCHRSTRGASGGEWAGTPVQERNRLRSVPGCTVRAGRQLFAGPGH